MATIARYNTRVPTVSDLLCVRSIYCKVRTKVQAVRSQCGGAAHHEESEEREELVIVSEIRQWLDISRKSAEGNGGDQRSGRQHDKRYSILQRTRGRNRGLVYGTTTAST